jgi:hypothetical protein
MKSSAAPLISSRNMMDLAICATVQPTRSAASCAVLALPISRGVMSHPARARASVTRLRLLLIAILRFFHSLFLQSFTRGVD